MRLRRRRLGDPGMAACSRLTRRAKARSWGTASRWRSAVAFFGQRGHLYKRDNTVGSDRTLRSSYATARVSAQRCKASWLLHAVGEAGLPWGVARSRRVVTATVIDENSRSSKVGCRVHQAAFTKSAHEPASY